jgi:predicted SAM-dependent methyltransferase
VKLNLGAGIHRPKGYHTVDLHHADTVMSVADFPWPWADDSVSEILASHVLEHVDRHAAIAVLAECWRVLRPGGVLRLAVPDFDIFADGIVTGDWQALRGYPYTDANYFFGGNPEQELLDAQKHKYAYTFENLAWKLREVGFILVTRRGPCELDNLAYAPISLYVDALK